MISQAVVPLAEDETGGSLFDKLAEEGAALLIRTIPSIEMELLFIQNSRKRARHRMQL